MKRTMIIFRKELLDTLRDRRTIFMMIVLPLVVIPLIMGVYVNLTRSQHDKAETKIIDVALIDNGNAQAFKKILAERNDMKMHTDIAEDMIEDQIKNKKLEFALVFSKDFDTAVQEKGSGEIKLYYKSSSQARITKRRVKELIDQFEKQILGDRLAELQLKEEFINPVAVSETDLASDKEKIGEYIGGFLPYLFVIFCFMGSMYPAIDLAAGEKERSTLETLLSSPAKRMEIVTGKFIVIALAGIVSALLGIVSIIIGVRMIKGIPSGIINTLAKMIEPQGIILVASLLIPLAVFFASMQLAVSLYAKSFKEAQSIMAPLNFVVFFPVIIGMIPGIKLSAPTALIPILNVSLATKEILSGHTPVGLLVLTYASLFILAAVSLVFCAQWFKREDVIFRGI